MYQRKSRQVCALMLTVSICLRLCMLLGLDARARDLLTGTAQNTEFARFLLFLETGQAADVEFTPPEPEVLVLRILEPVTRPTEAAEKPAPVPTVSAPEAILPETLAAAEELTVAGGCTYSYDKAALLARPSSLDFSGDGPKILIVHTHTTEAYTPEPGWEYAATTAYRTLDVTRSVVAVGEALAAALKDGGIQVIHDSGLNDYPSFNDAYATSLGRIQFWMEKYPGIQMVIDLHRDAIADSAGGALALSSVQNGLDAAQLMLVVGTDQGGLNHPNWPENLANALKLQSVLQGQYPGLCRSIDLRTERFNQHTAPGALLVEVGTNGNTLQQAIRSAQLLGDGLLRMIHALDANHGTLTQ